MKWAKKKKEKSSDTRIVTGGSKTKLKRIVSNKWFLILAGVVLLVSASYGLYTIITGEDDETQRANVCDEELQIRATQNFTINDNPSQLKDTVEKVQKRPQYQQDPNCMYIIVNYHLINFNLDEAQTAYTELVEVYDEESGFSPVLTAIYGEDLSALEKRMLATLESAKQLENNMIYYN